MRHRRSWLFGMLALVLAATLAACSTTTGDLGPGLDDEISTAIKYGTLDGDGHPFVGIMVAQDAGGNPMWRCSGTLISPTLFLTAGHCTETPAANVEIWFDADVESGIPDNGYPLTGEASGTPYTHPDFYTAPFFFNDLGMVVLDEPIGDQDLEDMGITTFPVLPALDQLDELKVRRGRQDVTFTAVGYGLQFINPAKVESERVRMVAYPKLIQINVPGFTGDFSMLLSNNHATGGTCFGDSGGPNFLGDTREAEGPLVIAGVTSFGINGNCAGTGGVYRVDRQDDLDWVGAFLSGELPQPPAD